MDPSGILTTLGRTPNGLRSLASPGFDSGFRLWPRPHSGQGRSSMRTRALTMSLDERRSVFFSHPPIQTRIVWLYIPLQFRSFINVAKNREVVIVGSRQRRLFNLKILV